MNDPIRVLMDAIARGDGVPLAWVVEWCDGESTQRAWNASGDRTAMCDLLLMCGAEVPPVIRHDGHPIWGGDPCVTCANDVRAARSEPPRIGEIVAAIARHGGRWTNDVLSIASLARSMAAAFNSHIVDSINRRPVLPDLLIMSPAIAARADWWRTRVWPREVRGEYVPDDEQHPPVGVADLRERRGEHVQRAPTPQATVQWDAA